MTTSLLVEEMNMRCCLHTRAAAFDCKIMTELALVMMHDLGGARSLLCGVVIGREGRRAIG